MDAKAERALATAICMPQHILRFVVEGYAECQEDPNLGVIIGLKEDAPTWAVSEFAEWKTTYVGGMFGDPNLVSSLSRRNQVKYYRLHCSGSNHIGAGCKTVSMMHGLLPGFQNIKLKPGNPEHVIDAFNRWRPLMEEQEKAEDAGWQRRQRPPRPSSVKAKKSVSSEPADETSDKLDKF
jgi:hypothetical protein